MSWTDEKVTLLRELWGKGLSASEIAKKLGDTTRNAVIGKAHRLGLSIKSTVSKAPKAILQSTIIDLSERMCKWPIGDPKDKDFHFCGKSSHSNFPYCAKHVAMAYQTPKRRKKDLLAGIDAA